MGLTSGRLTAGSTSGSLGLTIPSFRDFCITRHGSSCVLYVEDGVTDESSTDNDGTATGTSTATRTIVPSEGDTTAILCSNGSNYISFPDNDSYDFTTTFTIILPHVLDSVALGTFNKWATNEQSFTIGIYDNGGSTAASGYACNISSDGTDSPYGIIPDCVPEVTGSTNANTPARCLIVVYDGTLTGNANRLKMYLDGVQREMDYSGTIPASMNVGTAPVTVGHHSIGGSANCPVYVNQFAMFNTALSADECLLAYLAYAEGSKTYNP